MSDAGIKVSRKRGFTIVYNDMLPEGAQISARAWGLYVYLLSRPDGWECRVSHLRTVFKEGRDAIYAALKELTTVGLMGMETYSEGGLKRSRYTLDGDVQIPPRPGNPDPENPHAGNPDPEKAGQVSKDRTTTEGTSDDSLRSSSRGDSKRDLNEGRDDVVRLCEHLAARMVSNGCKVPEWNGSWKDAARLMMDRDGRSEEKIHKAIDWAHDNEFWRANILSMPTLREKYDQLRLQAEREVKDRRMTNRHAPQTPESEQHRANQAKYFQ